MGFFSPQVRGALAATAFVVPSPEFHVNNLALNPEPGKRNPEPVWLRMRHGRDPAQSPPCQQIPRPSK